MVNFLDDETPCLIASQLLLSFRQIYKIFTHKGTHVYGAHVLRYYEDFVKQSHADGVK